MVNNEAFSRVLIDKALEASGWNLTDPLQVHLEYNTANGRVDYLLKDTLGRVLCVLEAKRRTRERKAVRAGEAWEGWPVTWAGPIHRSRFDMGKYERTVE